MKVTLAKALVLKNRLVNDITTLREKIKRGNVVVYYTKSLENVPEPKFTHDIRKLLIDLNDLTRKFIVLKTAISLANKDPEQQMRIFAMSEMKTLLATLKEVPCTQGEAFLNGYGDSGSYTITRVQMTEEYKEELIKTTQAQIDSMQEEMEKFNWSTEIEVPE